MPEKSEVVRMRVTPEEKSAILKGASALGLTMSAYMLFKLGLTAGEALGDAILGSKPRKK